MNNALEHNPGERLELLRLFCASPEAEARIYLRAPFSDGNHTYASDGKIVVRVPRIASVPACDNALSIALKRVWKQPPDGIEFVPVQPLADHEEFMECLDCAMFGPSPICEKCKGTNMAYKDSVEVLGEWFSPWYLCERIAKTPNPVGWAGAYPATIPVPALYFRFDGGGEGILMGMRPITEVY